MDELLQIDQVKPHRRLLSVAYRSYVFAEGSLNIFRIVIKSTTSIIAVPTYAGIPACRRRILCTNSQQLKPNLN